MTGNSHVLMQLMSSHGILTILEVLEGKCSRDAIMRLLHIVNLLVMSDSAFVESFCLIGEIPVMMGMCRSPKEVDNEGFINTMQVILQKDTILMPRGGVQLYQATLLHICVDVAGLHLVRACLTSASTNRRVNTPMTVPVDPCQRRALLNEGKWLSPPLLMDIDSEPSVSAVVQPQRLRVFDWSKNLGGFSFSGFCHRGGSL